MDDGAWLNSCIVWTFCLYRHPEAVRMQQMRWNAKFDALCQALNLSKADRERKAKSDELAASASGGDGQPAAGGDKPKRRRTMSR